MRSITKTVWGDKGYKPRQRERADYEKRLSQYRLRQYSRVSFSEKKKVIYWALANIDWILKSKEVFRANLRLLSLIGPHNICLNDRAKEVIGSSGGKVRNMARRLTDEKIVLVHGIGI